MTVDEKSRKSYGKLAAVTSYIYIVFENMANVA